MNNLTPKNWSATHLSDCLTLVNGRAYKQKELLSSGTPILRIQNLNEKDNWYYSDLQLPDDKYCGRGDLLFAWSATFGPYIWMGERCIYHYHIWKVKPKDNLDKTFAYYLLKSISEAVKKEAHGITMLHITKAKMDAWTVYLPPLEEQKRIAAILDKADRVRRKRQEAIRLTEELSRSIFLDMFGDPVTNPKGWEVAPLNKFGEIFTGNTPPRADPENYGDCIEWIKSDNITTPYHFLTEASEKLSNIGKKKGRIVPPGSILVCCIAGSKSSIGRAAIADREVAFNQQINAIVPNKSVDTYFLYSQFWIAQNLVQSESTDSMKGLVNKSKFSGIQFLKPPLAKQVEFREKFLKFIDINKRFEVSLFESENFFNSLLQRAFRGEL